MVVHLTFSLPEEMERYATAINGEKYRKIIERIENSAFSNEILAIIKAIKLDVMSGGNNEKEKSLEQDSQD